MNEHQTNYQPPAELPKPRQENSNQAWVENGLTPLAGEKPQAQTVETGSSQPSLGGLPPVQSPLGAVPSQPLSVPPVPSATATDDTSHLIADDVDLIEKEWVNKAKEIVERTKSDPYIQNKQMNQVKADYLKKRYNKDLKITGS